MHIQLKWCIVGRHASFRSAFFNIYDTRFDGEESDECYTCRLVPLDDPGVLIRTNAPSTDDRAISIGSVHSSEYQPDLPSSAV